MSFCTAVFLLEMGRWEGSAGSASREIMSEQRSTADDLQDRRRREGIEAVIAVGRRVVHRPNAMVAGAQRRRRVLSDAVVEDHGCHRTPIDEERCRSLRNVGAGGDSLERGGKGHALPQSGN